MFSNNEKAASRCKHSLRKLNDLWHILSSKGPSVDDLIWRAWTIFRPKCWQEAGSQASDTTSAKRAWQGSMSVIDLKFSSLSYKVSNLHGNRDSCLAGLSRFWFETLLLFEGFSYGTTPLTLMKNLKLHAAPFLWSSSFFFLPSFFLPQLSKAIITAPRCKSVLAMADKGWEIVSNDGSTSAETSQSCLFQQ